MRSINDRGAAIRVLVLALALTPCVCMGQNASIQTDANAKQDNKQIERLAMRAVRGEFTKKGVTDWTTLGFDPDLDAELKPLHAKREVAHAQDLLTELGGRRFSSDSAGLNSFHCRLNGLTTLVYLSAPSVMGDSATVHVLYDFLSQSTACHFFIETTTLTFARRGGEWIYTGAQRRVVT